MVHVHGRDVSQRAARIGRVPADRRLLVPVDVGKHEAMALVADATGERLVAPFTFALDRRGLAEFVERVDRVSSERGDAQIEVGVESAGHYHRPVTASGVLPSSWTLIELNPAHVTEQRRVLGKRGIKTDQVDLAAMFDLLVVGRGLVVAGRSEALQQLQAWTAMRHRRIAAVIAAKNQLLGQMDRAFPGAGRCVSVSLLDTKVGRLVIAEFADPSRLARLGVDRFRRFAAARDIRVDRKVAERFVAAAKDALPLDGAATARQLLTADLELLDRLEGHTGEAEDRIAELLPATPFAVLTTTPGWATVRAGRYGAALGEPARWPTARQVYRGAGLTPKTYESAGTRYDSRICREGSVELRGALLELGMGMWLCDPNSRRYATSLKSRGKPAGIIACAMARRANKIAFAMVRDQTPYNLHAGAADPVFTTPRGRDILDAEAGPDAALAMADRTAVTPITSLAPGLHPCPEPGQGQLTRPAGEVAHVSMGPTCTHRDRGPSDRATSTRATRPRRRARRTRVPRSLDRPTAS